jgi:acetoacetyl-CoA synthetase
LLLKHWTEHVLHSDIRPGDRVFYFTTCGWMMWNWLVGALAVGATIVLYDGSPFAPDSGVLWDLAQDEEVTFFGVGAKYLDACRSQGLRPAETHRLPALRTIASTGSPLSADCFEYVYDSVAADIHLASISGGTDICGCFVLGDPTRAVYAGEIQGPAIGLAVDVATEDGQSLAGQPSTGELSAAMPSQHAVGLW